MSWRTFTCPIRLIKGPGGRAALERGRSACAAMVARASTPPLQRVTGAWLLVSPQRGERVQGAIERAVSCERPAYDPLCIVSGNGAPAVNAIGVRNDPRFYQRLVQRTARDRSSSCSCATS